MKYLLQRKKPNRRSIKEAADTLPAGVCYFSESGMVKLCNRQALRLYQTMARRDLQTLAELRQALAECTETTAVSRIPGRNRVYCFPDGKVWQYTENAVRAKDGNLYTEAMFSDVTELYEKQVELESQIQTLRRMARRIRELSENAMTAAKEREILAAKTRLHAQMGENLTVMRQTLLTQSSAKAQDAAARAMRKTVQFLMADSETGGMDSGFEEFLQTAESSGVTVKIRGTLPQRREIRDVLVIAMRECLTNGVRHGEASEMTIDLSEENGCVVCTIANNGAVPSGGITPRGGLKNLQCHVAECGGEMIVRCGGTVSLTVSIPEKEEEKL